MQFLGNAVIPANGSANIENADAAVTFIVFVGSWNYAGVYLVFPNNGNAPVVITLGKYSSNPLITVSAYGNWGITLTNGSNQFAQPYVVYRIRKN